MRASVTLFVVAVFASCEAQQLELVPQELSPSQTADSGASGGESGSGGRASTGGSVANGGGLASGGRATSGSFGAGGGPWSSGGFPGAGGVSFQDRSCKGDQDCRGVGYCQNSVCELCGGAEGCPERNACNIFTGRCEPSCNNDEGCTDPFLKQCDDARHVCVQCTDNDECKAMSSTERFCATPFGVCVECFGDTDCGEGNRCAPSGKCKCTNDTGCASGHCDQETHECDKRP